MAYTQTDITALEQALASGALEVAFGAGPDRRQVKYRSQADMERQLRIMKDAVSPPASPRERVSYIQHSRD